MKQMGGNENLRTGIYARISTTGHGQDAGLQVDELRQVAGQRGWNVVGEYIDEGFSGGLTSRPALDRLMADARLGKLDLVVAWKLDRLGRSLQHLLSIMDELTRLGVQFVSLRDNGIDTTSPSGRLMLSMIGAFAEFEKDLIKERVLAGVRRAQANGICCGRPRVEMDIRPAVALLTEGRGLKQVAAILQVNKNTLRTRLTEAGEWPRQPGSKSQPLPNI